MFVCVHTMNDIPNSRNVVDRSAISGIIFLMEILLDNEK